MRPKKGEIACKQTKIASTNGDMLGKTGKIAFVNLKITSTVLKWRLETVKWVYIPLVQILAVIWQTLVYMHNNILTIKEDSYGYHFDKPVIRK